MEEKNISGILLFQIKRGITNTYKTSLDILEELEEEHRIYLSKLRDSLPEEHRSKVDLADYWHDSKYQNLRARILSVGNNSYRNIEEQFTSISLSDKRI